MKKINLTILGLVSLAFVLSGCSVKVAGSGSSSNTTAATSPSGIFITLNKGVQWAKKSYIANASGKPLSFADADASVIKIDPSDSKAIYFGSYGRGMYYSYDGGDSWQFVSSLGNATINDIAIDPVYKCRIYAAVGSNLLKSSDCTRSWEKIYIDNDPRAVVSGILVDPNNSNIIYVTLTRGDIIKSADLGASWQVANRLNEQIKKIIVDPLDKKTIFVLTNRSIYRSQDGAASFDNLQKLQLKDLKLGTDFKDLVITKNDSSSTIFLALKNGIVESNDMGNNWTKINLLTSDKNSQINAMVVNPKNNNEIFYVTNTNFYSTIDGGVKWTPRQLPTLRYGWILQINPANPNIIYMGVHLIEQKKGLL